MVVSSSGGSQSGREADYLTQRLADYRADVAEWQTLQT